MAGGHGLVETEWSSFVREEPNRTKRNSMTRTLKDAIDKN